MAYLLGRLWLLWHGRIFLRYFAFLVSIVLVGKGETNLKTK